MTSKILYDETLLMQDIANGSERAFKIVYDAYKKKIYYYAIGILQDEMLAEDVMQEVFLKIWLIKEELQHVSSIEGYLKRLTRNRSLDALRKLSVEQKLGSSVTREFSKFHNETEESVILRETRAALDSAIKTLPIKQREVYLLCQNQGLRYEDVAAQMNISVNTVKTHMKRALSSLRKKIGIHNKIVVVLFFFKLL